ncbi:MAG: protein-glutamate O-methyltransferase [Rhodobacterales bacterium]|nr:protein-glutamate O-methyltransferase [Rhodobacterales bacterium]
MNIQTPNGSTGTVMDDATFTSIAALAKSEAGLILSKAKSTMVQSRLRPRLKELGLSSFNSYSDYVTSNAGMSERIKMISALTTNVSHFFREPHHFEILIDQALPDILAKARRGEKVRIWSAGCSSGQEPYSIAMAILDAAPELATQDFLILASDIDPKITEKARLGQYSLQQIKGIPATFQDKYLTSVEGQKDTYEVKDEIKKIVRFRELNLLAEWPMQNKFDVILCRNVVIYFDAETQSDLWPRFHSVLKPDGWFFLGHSERVSETSMDKFSPIGLTAYRPIVASK